MSRARRRQANAVADEVETLERQLVVQLLSHEQLERLELSPVPVAQPSAGSRPAAVFRSASGSRYFFKAASDEHIAAELLACEVRQLGRRPVVPTAARELPLPGAGLVRGMLQPWIEHRGGRLPADPQGWTAIQREVMLREHPWEWLLANLDTHVDQYVLVGAAEVPLNVDWDHSLTDLHISELDRFTRRSLLVAPLRNALYDAYVSGLLELEFGGLRREVRRISRLSDYDLSAALARWAKRSGVSAEAYALSRARFFQRKKRLARTFGRFLRSLRRERRLRAHPSQSLPLGESLYIAVAQSWQRLVIDTLHDRAVVPFLKAYRRGLHLWHSFG